MRVCNILIPTRHLIHADESVWCAAHQCAFSCRHHLHLGWQKCDQYAHQYVFLLCRQSQRPGWPECVVCSPVHIFSQAFSVPWLKKETVTKCIFNVRWRWNTCLVCLPRLMKPHLEITLHTQTLPIVGSASEVWNSCQQHHDYSKKQNSTFTHSSILVYCLLLKSTRNSSPPSLSSFPSWAVRMKSLQMCIKTGELCSHTCIKRFYTLHYPPSEEAFSFTCL